MFPLTDSAKNAADMFLTTDDSKDIIQYISSMYVVLMSRVGK